MVAIVWELEIHPGGAAEFERFYGADGKWTKMSRRSRSFLGSSFLKDIARDNRYLLVEYWSEMLVYEQHRAYRSDAIASLERRRTMLVEAVEPLGIFTALDVPDRTGPAWSQRQ